jgi:ADP-ribose diphosphatase
MENYKKLANKVLVKNPYWEYRQDEFLLPGGEVGDYYYAHTSGSTLVIPLLEDGRIVMCEQFRYLNQKMSLEFAGGGQEDGITPLENAIKELKEETGYSAKFMEEIASFNPYNGVADEICRVFVARDLSVGKTDLDPTEYIDTVILTKDEIGKKIATNEIWDGMTLASWMFFLTQNGL